MAAALAGCGASAVTATDATQFFRQAVAVQYNGTVPAGGGRGCVKVSAAHFSCTASVTGKDVDVMGTVTVSGGNMATEAHQTTPAAIQAWLTKTGGVH
jgi:hypothetical protein